MQEVMPTSYNAIFFASYVQAHYSRVMQLQETIEIPTNLYVRCGVTGDQETANIDFANVNLIIKKYNN